STSLFFKGLKIIIQAINLSNQITPTDVDCGFFNDRCRPMRKALDDCILVDGKGYDVANLCCEIIEQSQAIRLYSISLTPFSI
ncbi:hypothetical protein, partial [Porphyromonas gingivalis]